jgi:gas vesicle protein
MFGLFRATLRAFAIGAVVGVLFAPRAGAETRKMLSERFAASLNQLLEIAALPPIKPERAATNGHAEPAPAKRTRAAGTDARTSS